MSDFKTPNDFRKGSYQRFPYQDPTYLSFALLFDFYSPESSPLLAGPAEAFLKNISSDPYYAERLADLKAFKSALQTINNELPWYWQSLNGLERLQQYNPMNAYMGGDDAKIEIETLESLNLPIAGLMHLYRRAVFDERKWNYILPINLRQFRMYVYVTEVRSIQINTKIVVNGIPTKLNKDAISGFPENFKPKLGVENSNSNIAGTGARPYFMIGLGYCEFDLTSGTNIFADLSKSPTEVATNSIAIKYEKLERIEARVLNGIVPPLPYTQPQLSPSPDSEIFSTATNAAELAREKIDGKIDEVSRKGEEALNNLAIAKKNQLTQKARDLTINRIPSFDNVFSNFVRGVDRATDVTQQTRNIGIAVQQNVYGIPPGATIGQGLTQGAINNLGNVND
jgi:hypothetical protein